MKKSMWLLAGAIACTMLMAGCGGAPKTGAPAGGKDSQKLIVYTSMKENLIKGIRRV
jgi:hypothetical protein